MNYLISVRGQQWYYWYQIIRADINYSDINLHTCQLITLWSTPVLSFMHFCVTWIKISTVSNHIRKGNYFYVEFHVGNLSFCGIQLGLTKRDRTRSEMEAISNRSEIQSAENHMWGVQFGRSFQVRHDHMRGVVVITLITFLN